MLRWAFRKTCRVLAVDSVHLAVSPLLFGKCKNTLLLASLLAPIALGSPVTASQANLLDPVDGFFARSLMTVAVQTDAQESQARSLPLSPSFAFVPTIGDLSAQDIDHSMSAPEGQSYERYPYLLLTAGLILLAFRPAGPAIAGRH